MPALSRRSQFLLWMIAALVASTALISVLVWEFRSVASRRTGYLQGVPETGAVLFFGEKQCGVCHSVNGSGGRGGPELSGKRPGTPAVGWLVAVLWNHQPGMWRQMQDGKAVYPRLDQEEMAHILAFLYQAGNLDSAGNRAAGRVVFDEKGCAHCHSVGSSGGNKAPELSAAATRGGSGAWTSAMWSHANSMIGPITRANGKWPVFAGTEMNDLIAYASDGAPTNPAKAPGLHGNAENGWGVFQKNCIHCHSVRGQGGNVGPGLGPEKDIPLSTADFAGVLWNHAPAMLKQLREKDFAPPTLQGEEMVDVLMFLASLRYYEPAGSPFLGERLFANRGCAQCHGSAAEGTRSSPRLRSRATRLTAVSFATALWAHGPKMRARADKAGITWPVLQATDVGDLISFLNSPLKGN